MKIISFVLVYVLVPLIIIPYLSLKSDNWFGLFGILFYYGGLLIAKTKQWIFFPIPLLFCFWYWYTYGFSPREYVAIYFYCIVCGALIYLARDGYNKYVHRTLPENEQNSNYNDMLTQMEERIEKYKTDHPDQKITQEIIEKIKNDIFFR